MPLGTDLVTFSPRVGATGDDRYDPGEDWVARAGTNSYSNPPTLTEINNGSGWNQIKAAANMRRVPSATYRVDPVNDFTALAYTADGDRVSAADFELVRAAINKIRLNEYLSAFSFANDPYTSGNVFRRQDILDLRKALATDFFAVFAHLSDYGSDGNNCLARNDTFFPPTTTTIGSGSQYRWGRNGANYNLTRKYLFFRLPSGLPAIATTKIYLHFHSLTGTAAHAAKLYKSNSHLGVLDTGDWGNLDTLEQTLSVPANGADEYQEHSVTPVSSGNHTWIIAHASDVAGTTPGVGQDETCQVSRINAGTYFQEMLKLYT